MTGSRKCSRIPADLVFRNSFKDIEYALGTLNETGARYEFECYDQPPVQSAYFFHEGLVKPPRSFQTVFGLLGGIGPHPDDVMHMKRTAGPLFGSDYRLVGPGAGRAQMRSPRWRRPWAATFAWDSRIPYWIGAAGWAESNAQQVRQVRKNHRGSRPRNRDAGRGAEITAAQGRG